MPAVVITSGCPVPSRSAITGARGGSSGAPRSRQRRRALVPGGRRLLGRLHRPAGQLGAVGLVGVDAPVLGGHDQLLHVVAVEVGVADRRLAAAAQALGERGSQGGVLQGGEHAPVDARRGDAAAGHLELHGELLLVGVGRGGREGGSTRVGGHRGSRPAWRAPHSGRCCRSRGPSPTSRPGRPPASCWAPAGCRAPTSASSGAGPRWQSGPGPGR